MAGVRYYNQTGPFWDFVASLEDQGRSHPLFGGDRNNTNNTTTDNNDNNNRDAAEPAARENAWEQGPWGFPVGSFPFRGRWEGHPHGPPPPQHPGPPPPPPHAEHEGVTPPSDDEPGNAGEGPSEPRGPHHHHHHGPHGARHDGRHFGGPRRGGRCRGGPRGGFRGPVDFAELLQSQIFGPLAAAAAASTSASTDDEAKPKSNHLSDFHPEVDVFDAADRFVVHISLPGAKKEDVGVSWDAETSALRIAGVVYRPGVDEELLKTLALDERRVGAFERVVRLGSRVNPAPVDVEGISAKMEEGILKVEVPKLESGFVDVKKVDIQ